MSQSEVSPPRAVGSILIWVVTVLIHQTFFWLGTKVLQDADVIGGRLEWTQAGIIAFFWVFIWNWMRVLRATTS